MPEAAHRLAFQRSQAATGVLMRFVIGAAVGVVSGLLLAAGIGLSGVVDVGAVEPDSPLTEWLLHTSMQRSVKSHAADIEAPLNFSEVQARAGFAEFNGMCVTCHGAPGRMRSAAGRGMRPRPPDLAHAAQQWDDASLFWIVKNGINMTGMPAFGPTHDDATIWNIVAFLKQLPSIDAEAYQRLEQQAGADHMHEH
jgi:mono/diheme cytochrome c family protein